MTKGKTRKLKEARMSEKQRTVSLDKRDEEIATKLKKQPEAGSCKSGPKMRPEF